MSDKKIGVIISILLILVCSVGALELTKTQDSVSLCPRNTQLFVDLVKNDGQQEQAVDVKVAGSSAAWATSIPTGFVLASGEQRAIYTYITPMSTTFPANYDLDVIVSTTSSSETARHSIIVKDCHILTTSSDLEKQSCPNEKLKYDININNLGEFQEIYSLKVEGQIADNVVLSESSVKLNAKEIKIVFAYINAPNKDGEYEFTVVADSQQSDAISSTKARLLVKPCYDYEVSAGREFVEFCEHSKETIQLTIKNKGSVINLYDLSVDGPLWASLDNKKLSMAPGASGKVNLILTPDYQVSGNFEIRINTLADKGNKAITTIKANIKKCNSIFIDVLAEADEVCNSMANKYNAIVKNDGEVANNFRLELDAPEWVSLEDDKSFSLGPGKEKTLTMIVNPGFNVEPAENDVTLRVLASNEPRINSEDSMKIRTISKMDCYMAVVDVENKNVDVYLDGSSTVPINIENRGRYKATYELAVSDTASSFVQLNPSIVEVAPGSSEVIYAYIAPNAQLALGDYKATVSAKLKDSTILASDSFNIKITDIRPKEIVVKESLWKRVKDSIQRVKIYLGSLFTKEITQEETKVEEQPIEIIEKTDVTELGDTIVESLDQIEEQVPVETEEAEAPVIEVQPNVTEEISVPEEVIVPEEIVEELPEQITNLTCPESIDLVTTINKLMKQEDSFDLVIKGQTHKITLEAASNDSVFLSIKSDVNYVLLVEGETKSVDLDGDGVSDLEITFNGFKNDKADLTFKKFGVEKPGIISNMLNKLKSFSFFNKIEPYLNYIVVAIILIILIIVVIKTKFHKKIMDFFEEEIEEEKVEEKKDGKRSINK